MTDDEEDEVENQAKLDFSRAAIRVGDESGVYEGDIVADMEEVIPSLSTGKPEDHARFIAGVQRGIGQADRGELLEHKDVIERIDGLFQAGRGPV